MKKPTAGRWAIHEAGSDTPTVCAEHGDETCEIVAELPEVEKRSHETTLANGRLIAAAPELLEALRTFVEQAKSYHHSTGHEVEGATMHGACDSLCEAIPAGEAAIAKAEGK